MTANKLELDLVILIARQIDKLTKYVAVARGYITALVIV